jgi:hypothetical protein
MPKRAFGSALAVAAVASTALMISGGSAQAATAHHPTKIGLSVTDHVFTKGTPVAAQVAVRDNLNHVGRGTVMFYIDGRSYRPVALNSRGLAQTRIDASVGRHRVTAKFFPAAGSGQSSSMQNIGSMFDIQKKPAPKPVAPAARPGTPAWYNTPSHWSVNWDAVAHCESGNNWSINTGNGYYGGLQFDYGTWLGAGGGVYAERADEATKSEQITIAEKVYASRGLSPWACGYAAG